MICISRRIGRSSRAESDVRSMPSKMIVPLVGSCSRISIRPSVDLPQPDSPTSPSVSPRRTSRSTPSTACTSSSARAASVPAVNREVLRQIARLERACRRSCRRRLWPAARRVPQARDDTRGAPRRHDARRSSADRAAVEAVVAARLEPAALGRRGRTGGKPRIAREPLHASSRAAGSSGGAPRCRDAAGRGRPPPSGPPRRRGPRTSRPRGRRCRRRRRGRA